MNGHKGGAAVVRCGSSFSFQSNHKVIAAKGKNSLLWSALKAFHLLAIDLVVAGYFKEVRSSLQ